MVNVIRKIWERIKWFIVGGTVLAATGSVLLTGSSPEMVPESVAPPVAEESHARLLSIRQLYDNSIS